MARPKQRDPNAIKAGRVFSGPHDTYTVIATRSGYTEVRLASTGCTERVRTAAMETMIANGHLIRKKPREVSAHA